MLEHKKGLHSSRLFWTQIRGSTVAGLYEHKARFSRDRAHGHMNEFNIHRVVGIQRTQQRQAHRTQERLQLEQGYWETRKGSTRAGSLEHGSAGASMSRQGKTLTETGLLEEQGCWDSKKGFIVAELLGEQERLQQEKGCRTWEQEKTTELFFWGEGDRF